MATTLRDAAASSTARGDDGGEFERRYLSGSQLYGDDFDAQKIGEWFADEEHGYAELYGSDPARHDYDYHALNRLHGFARLPAGRRFTHALGFGSNFGDELLPVLDRIDRVTLLDSSRRYVVERLAEVPVAYVLAEPSGAIDLLDASVDLITCFGVLHHIPNVSRVVAEFERVLMPGGLLMVREPTTSMGDWRRPRVGLTMRERGIPRALLSKIVRTAQLEVVHAAPCYFPPWVRLCLKLGVHPFASRIAAQVDAWLCRLGLVHDDYHRVGLASRFAPAHAFVIARKPASAAGRR